MFICDISIFNRYGKQKLDDLLRPLSLDWRELVVLLVIDQVPGITQRRLTPFLQTDKANVTKVLKRMEEQELIRREPDEADHRNKICFMTASGQGLVPELNRIMAQWETECFRGLSAQDLAEFDRISQKITANLTEYGCD